MPSKRQRVARGDDEWFIRRIEWTSAEFRLDLMEERARTAIREGYAAARIVVERPQAPEPSPIILPGSPAFGLLVGPDGKQISRPSASP